MPHPKPSLKAPPSKRMRYSVRLTPSPPKDLNMRPNSPNRKTSKNAKANSKASAKANSNANAKAMANRMSATTERGKMRANMRKILSRKILP